MADKSTMDGIASGLAAIDATIRESHKTGGPGTGLFMLLDNLAVAMHAAPRSRFPEPEPESDREIETGQGVYPSPPPFEPKPGDASGGPVPA